MATWTYHHEVSEDSGDLDVDPVPRRVLPRKIVVHAGVEVLDGLKVALIGADF